MAAAEAAVREAALTISAALKAQLVGPDTLSDADRMTMIALAKTALLNFVQKPLPDNNSNNVADNSADDNDTKAEASA